MPLALLPGLFAELVVSDVRLNLFWVLESKIADLISQGLLFRCGWRLNLVEGLVKSATGFCSDFEALRAHLEGLLRQVA